MVLIPSFEPPLVEAIRLAAKKMNLPEGQRLLNVGDRITHIPLIINGLIKVSRLEPDGRELLLYYIRPNESCAMTFTCCMRQNPSEIQAITEEPTEIFAIPIGVMDEWLVKYPTWKAFVIGTIQMRFLELLQTIDQIAFHKLDERLIHFLKEQSRNSGSALVNLSHEQIALSLATSREVVSRLLKKLENENKVLLYRNQVKILRDL